MDSSRATSSGCSDQRPIRSPSDRCRSDKQPQLTDDALRRHNKRQKKDGNNIKEEVHKGQIVVLQELRRLGVDLDDDFAHKMTPAGEGMAPMQRFVEELGGHPNSSRAGWVSREHSTESRGATKASSTKSE